MTIELSFLSAVALAGAAYLLGTYIFSHIDLLQRYFVPEPLIGGLTFAIGFLLLRLIDVQLQIPTKGYVVDFLVALLTTNMGLHITPKVFREGYKVFLLFLTGGLLLYGVQFLLVLPLALLKTDWLATAVLTGPLSFVGAPYNLNPPPQISPVADLLAPAYPQAEQLAQGTMMIGVFSGTVLAVLLGKYLFEHINEEPPQPPAEKSQTSSITIWQFSKQETFLIIFILAIVASAFLIQSALQEVFPGFKDAYLPVIVISYLLGGSVRLIYEAAPLPGKFPKKAITVLLLGPTMSLVLTYAAMSIPLHHLSLVTLSTAAAAGLAIMGSLLTAWLLFPLFSRLTDQYYASVVLVVFLSVTTGWGPIAMSFLRHYTGVEGPVEPMPVILPLNAFFLFPWLAIFMTRLAYAVFGGI